MGAMFCGIGLYSPSTCVPSGWPPKVGGAGALDLVFDPTNALTAYWAMKKMDTACIMFFMVDCVHISRDRSYASGPTDA